MDELKLLISMVADLPTLAVWVLVGYLCYKIAVIGSIYGVIRLLIVKAHDVMVTSKTVVKADELGCINDSVRNMLIIQIERLKTNNVYIHASDVMQLAKAIDKIQEGK